MIPAVFSPVDIPGRGLQGVIEGAEARLGTLQHCEPLIAPELRGTARDAMERIRREGHLGVLVAREGGGVAVLVLSDQIRPGARELVERLHILGVRPVRMLTGDHPTTAAQVARELGIDQWDAELLPEDKVRLLEEMRRQRPAPRRRALGALTDRGARQLATGVGVIGDGANDAPALAAADVSIAIGSIGSDAALESADIVLLNDDLTVIPWAVRLARRTRAVVMFNMTIALGVIAAMAAANLYGSLTGHLMPLPLAVFTHEGGTLLVVLNSLRLLAVSRPLGVREITHEHPDQAVESAEVATPVSRI
jgi:Cd2+/Zn2+-exporting ATPase